MQSIINYQDQNRQVLFDEPDEFELTGQEIQIERLRQEKLALEAKNAELECRLQHLEKIIAEYADTLAHHSDESDTNN